MTPSDDPTFSLPATAAGSTPCAESVRAGLARHAAPATPAASAAHNGGTAQRRRPWRQRLHGTLGLLPLLMALTACGPGVGGTGTGESPLPGLAAFGATSQPVCGAGFAAALNCPVGTTANPTPAADGTASVRFIDAGQGASLVVEISGNAVRLDALCQGLHFSGDWGSTASSGSRFYGSYLLDGSLQRVNASFAVQAVPGSTTGELTATLRDADGRLVLGPLTLRPAPLPLPSPGKC